MRLVGNSLGCSDTHKSHTNVPIEKLILFLKFYFLNFIFLINFFKNYFFLHFAIGHRIPSSYFLINSKLSKYFSKEFVSFIYYILSKQEIHYFNLIKIKLKFRIHLKIRIHSHDIS